MTCSLAWRRRECASLGWRPVGPVSIDEPILDVTLDSRQVGPGVAFCARRGERDDGHRYLEAARARGARVFFVECAASLPPGWSEETWLGPMDEASLHALGRAVHHDPWARLRTLGVTGTNGKTSVTTWAAALVERAGERVAVVGTLGFRCGDVEVPGVNTTPDALTLHRWAARAHSAGARYLIMEVSSHGLALGRVMPGMFDVVGFTGLGRDHLDFHGTLEAYRDAKALLFREGVRAGGEAVLWADDESAEYMEQVLAEGRRCRRVSAVDEGVDLQVQQRPELSGTHTICWLKGAAWEREVVVPAVGVWVGANAGLALLLASSLLGTSEEDGVEGLVHLPAIPGRMERVSHPDVPSVDTFVDYAHTTDALERALDGLRSSQRTLRVVFGCGGDRDRGKRPTMAECAARLADEVWVTSDNPRSEDPAAIVSEVMAGASGAPHVRAVLDRREAIAEAVQRDGMVLVAGKGHERGQIANGRTLAFDDRQEVRRALGARARGVPAGEAPWMWGWSAVELAHVAGGRLVHGPPSMPCGSLCTDSRKVHPGDVYVALRGDRFDGHDFLEDVVAAGARTLVVERDRSVDLPPDVAVIQVCSSVEAMGRLASALLGMARDASLLFPSVAITGSNGKTTTKEWCAAALRHLLGGEVLSTPGNYNNDIGMPLTVVGLGPHHCGAVLELGASRPGDIERLASHVRAEVAVVSSIGASHLEGLGSLEGVRRTKAGILAGGRTRSLVMPWSERAHPAWQNALAEVGLDGSQVWTVGVEDDATLRVRRPSVSGPVRLVGHPESALRSWDFEVVLPLPGVHHGCNAASALLGAWLATHGESAIEERPDFESLRNLLAEVVPPGGRWHVLQAGGYRWIDDAYNANPSSVMAALDLLATEPGVRVALLGEMRELGADAEALHAEVGRHAAQRVEWVVGVGPATSVLVDAARVSGARVAHLHDAVAAATWVRENIPMGATLLLKGSRGAALERVLAEFSSSTDEA